MMTVVAENLVITVESSVSISLSLSSGLTLSDDDLNECLRVRVIPGSTRLCPDPPNLSLVSGERCSLHVSHARCPQLLL
ncbi:hypothetical protein GBAR_LOCUS26618 [Geodia barretti]|uniref:Uncharacterized protein n=1 Tax=Geodia barretti TaxID=519541 RepID=A0AA35THQ3_GEOBA|nr:hypothetical protein GBAR_LOCUS26618 [Geodia barretti]